MAGTTILLCSRGASWCVQNQLLSLTFLGSLGEHPNSPGNPLWGMALVPGARTLRSLGWKLGIVSFDPQNHSGHSKVPRETLISSTPGPHVGVGSGLWVSVQWRALLQQFHSSRAPGKAHVYFLFYPDRNRLSSLMLPPALQDQLF